jgi:thiol-disulfide isomerase/thioredoxin
MLKLKKYHLAGLFALLIFLTSCESNDNAISSVYIPQTINRKVLVEFFTNSGCIPCIDAHHYFDQIEAHVGITPNDTGVIIVSIHTNIPYQPDPIYNSNVVQNNARMNYYNIISNPQGRADGNDMQDFSSTVWTAHIKAEMFSTKYMNITFQNNFFPSADSGFVTINIQTVVPIPTSDNKIFVVLTQDSIPYTTGPNGIKYPSDVMRYIVTGSSGAPITLTNGQTTQFGTGYSIPTSPANWYIPEKFNIVAFIQSTSTKQVYGVEKIKVIPASK